MLIGHGRLTAVEGRGGETYLYVGEGMSGSPAVSRDANGILSYHNAGKVQASSLPQDMRLQRMLGHLTTLVPANPQARCWWSRAAPPSPPVRPASIRASSSLTIAEIEPLVPERGRQVLRANRTSTSSTTRRSRVAIDDGRHFLATSKEKYDAITSDPFDPWVKGAANLYTKEFWELAKEHLNPGGVVTVWVPLYDSTMAVAKSEIATFFEAFPNGIVWGNTVRGEGYDIVLSGQVEPTRIDVDALERKLRQPGVRPAGALAAPDRLRLRDGAAADLRRPRHRSCARGCRAPRSTATATCACSSSPASASTAISAWRSTGASSATGASPTTCSWDRPRSSPRCARRCRRDRSSTGPPPRPADEHLCGSRGAIGTRGSPVMPAGLAAAGLTGRMRNAAATSAGPLF